MTRALLLNPTAMEAGLLAAAAARRFEGARAEAFDAFARTGLPHRRLEAWKWTDLRAALSGATEADVSPEEVIAPSHLVGLDVFEILMMNGRVEWAGAPPDGVALRLAETGDRPVPEHPLGALATAMSESCLIIDVAAGARVPRAIHLRRVAGAGAHHWCSRIRVGAGAALCVIETADGVGAHFSNAFAAIELGEGARLDRIILAEGSDEGVEASFADVRLAAAVRFRETALLLGARLSRTETRIVCPGPDADLDLRSAILAAEGRHADRTSLVRFEAPDCKARQTQKSALGPRARGVFQGKFHVASGAPKTDAAMRAGALLLADTAEAAHKPELEIYADDVACAHGATAGALDADALFYLRQRGLSLEAARALLVEAFIGEAFEAVDDDAIASALRRRALRWLGRTE